MVRNVDYDADAFLRGLGNVADKISNRAERQLAEVGDDAVDAIRSGAPERTGALIESVKAETGRDGGGPYVEVSVGPFYASFFEFGSSRTGSRPFFRPGLDRALSQFPNKFRRLLGL